MSSHPFVHLHCHSHYSLLDGASKIPDLIQRVKSLGMPAVALTDHGNLFGAVEFLREAKAAGIKPIVGLEAYVAPGSGPTGSTSAGRHGDERYAYHLTLLAQQRRRVPQPAAALVAVVPRRLLLQAADRQGDPRPAQRGADLPVGLRRLRVLADCSCNDRTAEAEKLAMWYYKIFGEGNFFVEIQNNGLQIQRDCMERELDVANRLGLPVVATSDAHYLTQDDYRGPRRLALHQHRQDGRPAARQAAVRRRRRQAVGPVPRPQPGRDVRGHPRA